MNVRVSVAIAVLGLVPAGCAEVVESPALTELAARGGCHWDCPPCHPNDLCSLAPCVLECPPSVVPCGPSACPPGDVCCNESCGICTEPDGACIQIYCAPPERGHACAVRAICVDGYRWSETACRCLPTGGNPHYCSSDADCRAFSNYCGGCFCEGLGADDPDPACPGDDYVLCFADPCMGQTAACIAGQCTVTSASTLESGWSDPATL